MQVDSSTHPVDSSAVNESSSTSRVIKVIKKLEVQVLCTQHNPVSVKSLIINNRGAVVNPFDRRLPQQKRQISRTRSRTSCWCSLAWRESRFGLVQGCLKFHLFELSRRLVLWRCCGIVESNENLSGAALSSEPQTVPCTKNHRNPLLNLNVSFPRCGWLWDDSMR
jgi:hypothetical protein